MPAARANGAGGQRNSKDGKVIYCGAVFCSIVGLTLLIVGVVVYYSKVNEVELSCTCPDGDSEGECCTTMSSLCDECWCTHPEEADGYCSTYDETSPDGGQGRSIAVAGLVVCVISACMLLSMGACTRWSETHLHEKRPPVANNAIA